MPALLLLLHSIAMLAPRLCRRCLASIHARIYLALPRHYVCLAPPRYRASLCHHAIAPMSTLPRQTLTVA